MLTLDVDRKINARGLSELNLNQLVPNSKFSRVAARGLVSPVTGRNEHD